MVRVILLHFDAFFVHFDKLIRRPPCPLCPPSPVMAKDHALSTLFFIVARSLFADLFEKIFIPLGGRPCPGLLCGLSSFLTGVLLA